MKEAKTTLVQATSKVSVKIKDVFYTFEAMEQIDVEGLPDTKVEQEKEMLWNRVHNEVDKQVRQVVEGGN